MSAYGYSKKTTPWLDTQLGESNLIFFKNAYSAYVNTVLSLTHALTARSQFSATPLSESPSIVEIAKASGFEVWWFSNQSKLGTWDTPISIIAKSANHQKWITPNLGDIKFSSHYDEDLIPLIDTIPIDTNGTPKKKKLLIIHVMGCHASYSQRYPNSFYKRSLSHNENYDTAIRYQDYVIQGIYNKLSERPDFQSLVVVSDHGEDPSIGHDADKFTWQMAHIPMFVFISDQFSKEHGETLRDQLTQNANKAFTNDLLFDLLCGILGITDHNYYNSENDISSKNYSRAPSELTILDGKFKVTQDPSFKSSITPND